MDEKRAAPRLRHLKAARIVFNGRSSTMSCILRDASASGARLECGEPYLLPREFDIVMRGEDVGRRARRVWIDGPEMGVRFTS